MDGTAGRAAANGASVDLAAPRPWWESRYDTPHLFPKPHPDVNRSITYKDKKCIIIIITALWQGVWKALRKRFDHCRLESLNQNGYA